MDVNAAAVDAAMTDDGHIGSWSRDASDMDWCRAGDG
jgi:hypothetical protein